MFKDRKEIGGSILKQAADVTSLLSLANPVQPEFQGVERIDHVGYPPEALREVLLNMLMHRDYGYLDSNKISLFEDRIEFVSIGGLVSVMAVDDLSIGSTEPGLGKLLKRIGNLYDSQKSQLRLLVSGPYFQTVILKIVCWLV